MISDAELNELKSKYYIPEITVDFYNDSYTSISSKQLDNARYILCLLTENGISRSVSSLETAKIRMKKPDNTYIYNDCEVTENGFVLIHLTEQMMAKEGIGICDIQLISSDGDIYSTQTFCVSIGNLPYPLDAIESTDDLSSVNELLAKEKERLKAVEELNNSIQTAENNRINAEILRENSEKQRESNESTRITNENTRNQDETIRKNNEITRETNETKRKTQENQRQINSAAAVEKANSAAEYAAETATDLQNKIDENYFVVTEELENSISSTSTTAAPTANAVKKAYEQAKSDSNSYTDQKIADLVNGAPETMDTLKEVADAIAENKDVEKALNQAIGTKADKTHTHTEVNGHTVDSDVPADAKFTDTVYTLPKASTNTLGGVETGDNITNNEGKISITKSNVCNAIGYTPPRTGGITVNDLTELSNYPSLLGSVKMYESSGEQTVASWRNVISSRLDSAYGMYIYTPFLSGDLKWRKHYTLSGNSTWTDERTILDSSNYKSYLSTNNYNTKVVFNGTQHVSKGNNFSISYSNISTNLKGLYLDLGMSHDSSYNLMGLSYSMYVNLCDTTWTLIPIIYFTDGSYCASGGSEVIFSQLDVTTSSTGVTLGFNVNSEGIFYMNTSGEMGVASDVYLDIFKVTILY